MNEMMKTFFLPSLTMVMDFAYIEDANGTHGILVLMEQLLRYELDVHEMATVEKEVEILKAVLEIYRYRFGNFQYRLTWSSQKRHKEIAKYFLVNKFIHIMESRQDECRGFDELDLDIDKMLEGYSL